MTLTALEENKTLESLESEVDSLESKVRFYTALRKLDYKSGYKDELFTNIASKLEEEKKEKLAFDEYEDLYEESVLVGILKEGMDGSFRERYGVTPFGKTQISSFLDVYELTLHWHEQ